ncbi:MAG: tRNA threonylcarbamoyladenosine biosynthesis protein TsaE [Rhizobacter sp.]|nr:tRNA threonylcarbamoyladenosine biosynthesis protein TsaE [Rhizobacter sp.]
MTTQDTPRETSPRKRSELWATQADCTTSAGRLASALARNHALGRAYIELHGALGAGKTTFARHLLQALGVAGRIKSPTYAVMESYEVELADAGLDANAGAGAAAPTAAAAPRAAASDVKAASGSAGASISIRHFDFYRFADPQEWEDAGFRDAFAAPGLKLAEWPEKAAGLLPVADLRIDIETVVNPQDTTDVEDGEEPPTDQRRVVTFTALTALGLELLP